MRYKPTPGIYQQQNKSVPYTISNIGGPDELKLWKQEQVKKEEEYQARKQAKFEDVKQSYVDATLSNTDMKPKYASTAWDDAKAVRDQHAQIQEATLRNYEESFVPITGTCVPTSSTHKVSKIKQLFNHLIELFESI